MTAADLSDFHVGNGGESPRPSAAWAMYARVIESSASGRWFDPVHREIPRMGRAWFALRSGGSGFGDPSQSGPINVRSHGISCVVRAWS